MSSSSHTTRGTHRRMRFTCMQKLHVHTHTHTMCAQGVSFHESNVYEGPRGPYSSNTGDNWDVESGKPEGGHRGGLSFLGGLVGHGRASSTYPLVQQCFF